jgi:hypothetical protein
MIHEITPVIPSVSSVFKSALNSGMPVPWKKERKKERVVKNNKPTTKTKKYCQLVAKLINEKKGVSAPMSLNPNCILQSWHVMMPQTCNRSIWASKTPTAPPHFQKNKLSHSPPSIAPPINPSGPAKSFKYDSLSLNLMWQFPLTIVSKKK